MIIGPFAFGSSLALSKSMSANGMVRPCSGPASMRSWRGGAQDKEHTMSQKLNAAIAVIGIDIGKNSFQIS
jgi:transposase